MRGIISTLLIAAAAMLFISAEASASWTCAAYGTKGNSGWGKDADKGVASQRAVAECSKRGGGCRITNCKSEGGPNKNTTSRPTPTPACPPGQQRNDAGRCYHVAAPCSAGQRRAENGRCYAIPCPPGQQRNDAGRCYAMRCPDGQPMPSSGRCPAVVEYKKCPNGERVPVADRCPAVVEYKKCPNGERIPVADRCPAVVQYKDCPNGKRVPVSERCPTIVDTVPAPRPREASIKCDLGPVAGYPSAGDLPRSIYEIKIGNTSLFAGGYTDVAPNRNECKGVTANGCYLRVVNVPKVNGGTGEACVQFCKEQLCPPKQVITRDPTPPPPLVARIPDERPPPPPTGKPAVLTLIAPPYVVPKPRGKPAVPTVIAAPYVAPQPRGKPAVPTVIAAPYVVPVAKGKPAVPTVIAPPYVAPAAAGKRPAAGAGYQLFLDGKLASGPDAASYSLAQARENCAYNNRTKPNVRVECLYDGKSVGW